jgi:hypothetical protein
LLSEPVLTPSIIASIPDLLTKLLTEKTENHVHLKQNSILISSNTLSNRFILTKWGIRPSQRCRHKNLFSDVRKACRDYFNYLIRKGRISCTQKMRRFDFGVFKFDKIRGNLILGFASIEEHPFL